MLRPHAYGTAPSSATCRSGVRRSDRMEVGRRKRRYSLRRSTGAGCRAHRPHSDLASRFRRNAPTSGDCIASAASAGHLLSQFRDLAARRSGHRRQYGWSRRSTAALRAEPPTWTLPLSLFGRPSHRRPVDHRSRFHASRCAPWTAHTGGSDSGRSRHSNRRNGAGSLHRSARVDCATSSWAYIAYATKDTRATNRQQVAAVAAQLCNAERRPTTNQSAHELARSSIVRARGRSAAVAILVLAKRAPHVVARVRGAMA